jgi:hypothetical protein
VDCAEIAAAADRELRAVLDIPEIKGKLAAMTPDVALKGLAAGALLMFGAFIAKAFVLHLKPDMCDLLMDGIMIAAGLSQLWSAAFS